ncbi:MAG: hypothetical protein QM499_07100 [Flavobacteriaceae bacterium]
MNKTIFALVDYKRKFGSKHFDIPYRSGMDKKLLSKYFFENGFEIEFVYFHEVNLRDNKWKNSIVIYTSSEDIGYHYKSFIEDVIYGLEEKGAKVLPSFKYLRANNNKTFMESLRDIYLENCLLKASSYGSLKELLFKIDEINFPIVLKPAEGASGTGVSLVKNKKELIKNVKDFKSYSYIKEDAKDYLRAIKHKGYQRESIYRNKFIIQEFIPKLKNDWKVYVFGDKYYIFKRPIFKGRGIKASGGGYDNYLYGQEADAPNGIFDYCKAIFKKLNLPHLSLDIAYVDGNFYLIEFQGLYFGTAGIPYSLGFFINKNQDWIFVDEKYSIEKVYVESVKWFLEK